MTTTHSSSPRQPSPVVVEAPAGESIMDRLRVETSDLHRLAESSGWQRAMVQGAVTPALLARWLAQLLPIHRALEDHLSAHRAASANFSVFKDHHQREPDLIADIARLDTSMAMPEPLPAARAFMTELARLAVSDHPEALLGVLYVLEGSTNGNKFIARGLMRAWRWSEDQCPRYLNPYGEAQPQRWQQFKDDVNAIHWTTVKRLAIIDGARAAFTAIHALSVEMMRIHPINPDAIARPRPSHALSPSHAMSAGVLAATLAFAGHATAGIFEYAADDGTGSINIGPSFNAEMLWGNYFTAEPGHDTITTIRIAFGSIAAGRPIDLLLFDDPDDDGNPANAVLVTQTAALTNPAGLNAFTDYAIEPTGVSGGFFVAAKMMVTTADRPARLDPQSITGQSWLFFADQIPLDNLGSSPFVLNMNNAPFPGTWMMRAQAVPGPSALAIMLVFMIGSRRRMLRT